jgi:lipoprotein-releasing system permease protein
MNGFQKEVRDRMLSVIAHIEVFDAQGGRCPTGSATAAAARRDARVVGAAPFVSAQALVARGDEMRGAVIRGIDPAARGRGDRAGARTARRRAGHAGAG